MSFIFNNLLLFIFISFDLHLILRKFFSQNFNLFLYISLFIICSTILWRFLYSIVDVWSYNFLVILSSPFYSLFFFSFVVGQNGPSFEIIYWLSIIIIIWINRNSNIYIFLTRILNHKGNHLMLVISNRNMNFDWIKQNSHFLNYFLQFCFLFLFFLNIYKNIHTFLLLIKYWLLFIYEVILILGEPKSLLCFCY